MSKEWKLGDTIDDYCSRCQLLMNHYVVSMVDTEVGKVRCQTCSNEHNYRHGKGGKRRVPSSRSSTKWPPAFLPLPDPRLGRRNRWL